MVEAQAREHIGTRGILTGAMRQILGPIGGIIAGGLASAGRDLRDRLLREFTPGCTDRDRCWRPYSDALQATSSGIFRFIQDQSDQNALLIAQVREIVSTTGDLQEQIDRELGQVAALAGQNRSDLERLYAIPDSLSAAVRAHATKLINSNNASPTTSPQLIRFSAEVQRISGKDNMDREVDELHRQVRQFYRSALARTTAEPRAPNVSPTVVARYRELASTASASLRRALDAYDTSYQDAAGMSR